jgi:thiol-disulfide isomerase/thioredoxin
MRSFFIILFLATNLFAQSGKVKPELTTQAVSTVSDELSAEKMYAEANDYAKTKFAEFNEKKIKFNEALRLKTIQEQKQLAAKYASLLSTRQNLTGEDFYFLGMLHWLAENNDGAFESLKKFLAGANPNAEKAQTSRGVVTIVASRKKIFDEAEKYLADYLAHKPAKPREQSQMANELAAAYTEAKNFTRAAEHAETAYQLVKATFSEENRGRGLAEILDRGRNLFEIYSQAGEIAKADATLENLTKVSATLKSNGIYYFAVDSQIKYLIETGRKPKALAISENMKAQLEDDFPDLSLRADLTNRFKRREKHYKLLGEPAPELVEINTFLPFETKKTLAELRGKVVLMDFWATWCGPCFETFPYLSLMHENFQKDGLEILGMTRFYGNAEGVEMNEKEEIEFIQRFKLKQRLPYNLVIAQNSTNQIIYGAGAIPTAVIIDRKGIIRYIESGTNSNRGEEIQAVVEKLLAENWESKK